MNDSQEVALKMLDNALAAAQDVPEKLRQNFLRILAHRHREAADMIEAEARRGSSN